MAEKVLLACRTALTRIPESAWGIVLDTEGDPGEAAVVELTAVLAATPR